MRNHARIGNQIIVATAQSPLLHDFKYPHREVFYPYGFALLVRTNQKAILDIVRENWIEFSRAVQELKAHSQNHPPLELNVAVVGESKIAFPSVPAIRSQGNLMWFVSDAEHFGTCDFQSGIGYLWITPRTLADPEWLLYYFIEALGYALVGERYMAAIHSACVAHQGRGILLCGDSGAGKSTLAYACARRGWSYVSDDGSFLLRDAQDSRIVGNPHRIRLRPPTASLFPELQRFFPRVLPNGKEALQIRTKELPSIQIADGARVECLVFLKRREGSPTTLAPFSKQEAQIRMEASICFGRDSSQDEQKLCLKRVLRKDVFEMTYCETEAAIDCLEALLSGGSPAR